MRIGILFATIVALCACSPIAAAAQDTSWQVDPGTAKDWFDPANWTNGVPNDDVYTAYIDNGGTARISAGSATSPDLWVGHDNAGRLILAAGSLNIQYGLLLGAAPTSHGTVEINGGSLITQSLDLGANLGTGTVVQTGGSVDALYIALGGSSYWSFFSVDGQPGDFGTGEYQLIGGRWNATQLAVGNAGSGTFRQLGGTSSVDTLKVGGVVGFSIIYLGPVATLFPDHSTPIDAGVTNFPAAIAAWAV